MEGYAAGPEVRAEEVIKLRADLAYAERQLAAYSQDFSEASQNSFEFGVKSVTERLIAISASDGHDGHEGGIDVSELRSVAESFGVAVGK